MRQVHCVVCIDAQVQACALRPEGVCFSSLGVVDTCGLLVYPVGARMEVSPLSCSKCTLSFLLRTFSPAPRTVQIHFIVRGFVYIVFWEGALYRHLRMFVSR